MPETACLHIQAQESDPVRVVDLPGSSARIGRAAYCDVRLADPDLADEECRLRRRGSTWRIVPVAPDGGALRLDGHRVDRPTELPYDTTFYVGSFGFTLRTSSTASPWTDRPLPLADIARESAGSELVAPQRNAWESQGDARDRWLRAQRETKRWETRWRAAGEKLRASHPPAPAPVAPPTRPDVPTLLETRSTLRRPEVPTAQIARTPVAGSTLSEAPRPAGYEPPSAPRNHTGRAPVRSAGWAETPAPVRPKPPEAAGLRLRRAEPTPTIRRVVPKPPLPTLPIAPDPGTAGAVPLLTGLGISRIEHDDLDDLISRYSAPDPLASFSEPTQRSESFEVEAVAQSSRSTGDKADVEPSSGPSEIVVGSEPEEVTELEAVVRVETGSTLEDDDDWDEPEDARPVLGSTRRGSWTRQDVEASEWVRENATTSNAERTGADTYQAGPTRWVAHKPTEVVESNTETIEVVGGWSYQVPFVTDTNVVEPLVSGAKESASTGSAGRLEARTGRDWPTVGEILAAQGVRAKERADVAKPSKKGARRPEPTAPKAPQQWRLPIWLAWIPGASLMLAVGIVGLTAAIGWTRDGYNAGIVARRLADAEISQSPLPEGIVPPEGSWWSTSAAHLVDWAAYLDRTGDDPTRAEEARQLLDRAARLAPLNPSVRYALARPSPGEALTPSAVLARGLGQSRDVPALAWVGRALLAAGKKEPALRAFREALEMGSEADLTRAGLPAFLDDPQIRRYALPTEDALASVVREMAASSAWSYRDWASALPRGTASAVVAARVLRESGSPDAETALNDALAWAAEDARGLDADRSANAVRLASWAEALAMKQKWAEARDRYRLAVDLMPVDLIRRAWWLNLADLESRVDGEPERQKALEQAKVADLKDEVTRRAVDLQRASGTLARRPLGQKVGPDAEARR